MSVRRRKTRPGQISESVIEASGEDAQAVVEASGDNPTPSPPVNEQPNPTAAVNKFVADYPRPGVAWGNIIRDTLKIKDPAGLARRLRAELVLDDHTSYSLIIESLNKAASNFDEACRLHRAAKIEELEYKLVVDERMEVMKTAALDELMYEYHSKQRKSPTVDDTEQRMLKNWPDEYRALKVKTAELHGAVRSLEKLMEAWKTRSADLRVMADRAARANV